MKHISLLLAISMNDNLDVSCLRKVWKLILRPERRRSMM